MRCTLFIKGLNKTKRSIPVTPTGKKASWFKGGKLTRDRSGTFVDGRTTELSAYRSALKLPSLAI